MDRIERRSGNTSKTCQTCGRTFARLEHLDRHKLTHTQSKPHECRHCGQRFQRSDVLYRHVSKYCPNVQPQAGAGRSKRSRIRVACFHCRDKKLKCDGKKPCANCTEKGYNCRFRDSDAAGETRDASNLADGHEQTGTGQAPQSSSGNLMTPASSHDVSMSNIELDVGVMAPHSGQYPPQPDPGLINPESWNFEWMMDMEMNDYSFFDWMPNEASVDLSPHMWGFEYNTSSFVPQHVSPNLPVESNAKVDRRTKALETLKEELGTVYERVRNDEPSIDTWLKQPFVPRTYDLELLNLFLNLFMEYVPSTFRSFSNFTITETTLPEQVLAMSAVGALFSNIDSSWKIARTLYGDASRMIVAHGSSPTGLSPESYISLAQTHLAFEIFGFCSGHKRSNELTEAFHHHTMQSFADGALKSKELPIGPTRRLWHQLYGDLFVIECYRVCLAQLPPVIRPDMAREYLSQSEPVDSDSSPSYIASLTPFSNTTSRTAGSRGSMDDHEDCHRVAAHSILSWFSMGMWTDTSKPFNATLWRREVPELSLRRLQIDDSSSYKKTGILLYHMNICALHSPMELINSFAYSYAHLADLSSTTIAILRQWHKDEDCEISYHHAAEIRRLGRQRMLLGEDNMPNEAPHDALCVFLATLVSWAADVVILPERGHQAIVGLEEGIEAMRTFKVRVKAFLISILENLVDNTQEECGSPVSSR